VGEASPSVRAVTKPEPLPPFGLRLAERRLGENRLAWDPNVETDVVGYRLRRIRAGSEASELVASVPSSETEARDPAVGADEVLDYTVVAVDREGLESDPARPIAVESEGYGLTAEVRMEGVRLRWNPRTDEGFHGARITRSGVFAAREFPLVQGDTHLDAEVKPGHRYRYSVELERPDGSLGPRSAPVEIRVPEGGNSGGTP
jgi:fibronectin type 3 domain-containing protein